MEYTNINDDVVEIYLLTVKYIHNLLKKKLQNSIWSVNPSLIETHIDMDRKKLWQVHTKLFNSGYLKWQENEWLFFSKLPAIF